MRTFSYLCSFGVLVLAGMAAGCSSGSSSGGPNGSGGSGGSGATGGSGGSGASAGAGGSAGSNPQGGAGGQGGSAGTGGGSPCGDTQTDPKNCGACGHDCLGGACQAGMCQPEVLRDNFINDPYFLVDDNQLFWCSSSDGKIMHGPKTPGATDTLLADVGNPPFELAQNKTQLAWLDCNSGSYCDSSLPSSTVLKVMDKTGGTPVTLGSQVEHFALDDNNAYYLSGDAGGAGLFRVGLGGGSQPAPLPTVQGNPSFYGFYAWDAVVAGPSSLYVTGLGYSGQGAVTYGVPKNGSQATLVENNPDSVDDFLVGPNELILGYSGSTGSTYCSGTQSLRIVSESTMGGMETTIVKQSAVLSGLRIDGQYIYWRQYCNGSIWRVPLSGGTPKELWAGDNNESSGLQIDSQALYFITGGSDQLMRLAK